MFRQKQVEEDASGFFLFVFGFFAVAVKVEVNADCSYENYAETDAEHIPREQVKLRFRSSSSKFAYPVEEHFSSVN
jgi:hypothetical protein